MPQFDFTTYSSQIFWFSICFAVLYYFMGSVILPRIRNISAQRKAIVSADLSAAASIKETTQELRQRVDELSRQAGLKYKMALENAVKSAVISRDKSLEEFKNNAEKMIEKSHEEIAKIIKESQEKSYSIVDKLTEITENKIFNS